jgi:YhcH/YjgK/YiaL family protein
MIVDTLVNINQYKSLSENIYKGLQFLAKADPGIALGIHVIDENVTAIVSEYETIACFERGYEAHKHVIDIQYPIIGLERVKWSPLEGMKANVPYDKEKDRTFYGDPSKQGVNVDIGNGVFVIMFPNDGHSPQHFLDKAELIKKITIKIKIN